MRTLLIILSGMFLCIGCKNPPKNGESIPEGACFFVDGGWIQSSGNYPVGVDEVCGEMFCIDGDWQGQNCDEFKHPAGCIGPSNAYSHGEVFKADCNTCWCNAGSIVCTLLLCNSQDPESEGEETIPTDACLFIDGGWVQSNRKFSVGTDEMCGEMFCIDGEWRGENCNDFKHPAGCSENGKNYSHKESFKNDCNTCQCNAGSILCSALACSGQ